jgi:kynurenine formamidase
MTTKLVDLSHAIEDGMVTYPGLPGPVITDHLAREASRDVYAPGTEFAIGRISMVANTGTYVDSPFHRYADGADLAGLRLERVAEVEGVLVSVVGLASPAIGPAAFEGVDVGGKAVLVHTGWSRHWRTEAYGAGGHPHLTEAACDRLIAGGAWIVGIDSVNIDDTSGGERVAHTALLGAGIPVVEHLRGLERLPERGFTFSAVPPRVVGFGTFPVRAYARVRG